MGRRRRSRREGRRRGRIRGRKEEARGALDYVSIADFLGWA